MSEFHISLIPEADKESVSSHITNLLENRGIHRMPGITPHPEGIQVAIREDKGRVLIYTSDPFLSSVFDDPNDFFAPLSQNLSPNPLFLLDSTRNKTLQYWIYRDGSCEDQYLSKWKKLPAKERNGASGNPAALSRLFPNIDEDTWKNWLEKERGGKRKLARIKKMLELPEFGSAPASDAISLQFFVPHSRQSARPRLFPWIVFGSVAAYFGVRYRSTPELIPVPFDYDNSPEARSDHKWLTEQGFHFFGDFQLSIAVGADILARFYYREQDRLHVSQSCLYSPTGFARQSEVTLSFENDSKATSTNAEFHPPFDMPDRTLFWKPDLRSLPELINSHLEEMRSSPFAENVPKPYSVSHYPDEMKKELERDFQSLGKQGFLRSRGTESCGLTWKGAFTMLYRQWKSSHR